MKLLLVLVLTLSGCVSFGSGPGVTTVERERTACSEEGGVWTQNGCVTLPLLVECIEANGFVYLASNSCSISVGEDE